MSTKHAMATADLISLEEDEGPQRNELYERTYSRSLSQSLGALHLKTQSTTVNDFAIACALAEDHRRSGSTTTGPRPDTSHDRQLAVALYEREAGKLVKDTPSRREFSRAFRRSRTLRSLLRHLTPTNVS